MANENLGISEVVAKLLIKADEDKIKELIKKEIDEKDKTIIFVDSLNMKIDGLIGGLIKVVYGAVAIKDNDAKSKNKQDEINASIDELIIQSVFLQKIDENDIVELTKMMTKNDLEKLDITEKDIAKALANKYNTDVDKVKFNW